METCTDAAYALVTSHVEFPILFLCGFDSILTWSLGKSKNMIVNDRNYKPDPTTKQCFIITLICTVPKMP